MSSQLAVVILNYNGAHYLQQFLPSVIQYSQGHRIIVADNASTDHSVSILQQQFPEVELIPLASNTGYAGGYNEALKRVDSTYYLLLNSDVEVTEGWIDPLLQLLENQPQVAACQPKILAHHNRSLFEYAGAAGGFLDELGFPYCRGRIFDTLEKDQGQYNEPVPIFWASGACMLIRANLFHTLDRFDARFFAHMEEIDLCWRIHRAGYKIYACPQSKVYHVGGGTLPKTNPRKTYLNFRNGLWMLYKNSSSRQLSWKLPIRMLLDWAASLQFLLKGQFKNATAVYRAHYHALSSLPSKERQKISEIAIHNHNAPLYPLSIVWKYYAQNIKTFEELIRKEGNMKKVQNKGDISKEVKVG